MPTEEEKLAKHAAERAAQIKANREDAARRKKEREAVAVDHTQLDEDQPQESFAKRISTAYKKTK